MPVSFTLPTPTGAFGLPSMNLASVSASVLDDAKDKAKNLEGKAADASSKAAADVKGEVSKISGSAPAPPTKGKIALYSPQYYYTCAAGGLLACGLTHAFVTPLDLVKCRRQVDKNLYKSNFDGWKQIWSKEGGLRGIYTGGGPTLVGYSLQGAAKFGFYELFKKKYADAVGPEFFANYKALVWLAGSASAEFLADIALVPWEAVKVRQQTTFPPFANGTFGAFSKFAAQEGYGAMFKSLPSLWGRQIPYTMMKFASFEKFVELIYSGLGKPKSEFNKIQQLGVSFVAGYAAGVFCAVVSQPADNMVSKLNAVGKDGSKPTVGSVYKELGFFQLATNGLPVRIAMVGTLTALQWLLFDYVKTAAGLPTTGAAEPKK